MSRLAFFGGSFDPIHNGHLYIMNQTYTYLELEKLFILPNNNPPHKDKLNTTNEQRCEMINLAIGDDSRFELSDLEASNQLHYTVDTVKRIREIYQNDEIYFIIGADSLLDFDKWYKPKEILQYVSLAVLPRDDKRSNEDIQSLCKVAETKYGGHIIPIVINKYDISSTDIRLRIQEGKSIRGYVSECVEEYILRNGLYIKK